MKLIFAQGNPESKYDGTRHNVGFMVIDEFARAHDASWNEKTKFSALIAEMTIDGEKVILAKPTTYYNETGQSARKLIDFYNLDPTTDVIVIHDELALPFGTIRTRKQGSDAGNNGIKSLNNHIGSDYHRIRIGVANDMREKAGDVDFVLGRFSHVEADSMKEVMQRSLELITLFIHDNLENDSVSI